MPYIEPKRPRRRRAITLWVLVIAFGSLFLSILTQPWLQAAGSSPDSLPIGSLFFVGQIIVVAITTLAAIAQISGFSLRDVLNTRSAHTNAEAFPFHVVRSPDELASYLLPDPTEPVLPDRAVQFMPRIAKELDVAFRQHGQVLICGRSKTGKTREAVEMLARWWRTGPTVLIAKNHVSLRPPFAIPENLPVRNVVLFFDDVDRYCEDEAAVQRLDQTTAFFADLCHDPEELRVVATARQEPEYWQRLQYTASAQPWAEMNLVTLPPLSEADAYQLISALTQQYNIETDETITQTLARKNDGTFLNVILTFRSWLAEGVTKIQPENIAAFQGDLKQTWRHRYERLAKAIPQAKPIYAAVSLMQKCNIPLQTGLITDLATELSLGRMYHMVAGLTNLIWQRIDLSPRFDWYRDRRRRRRRLIWGGVLGVFLLYAIFYVFLCFTSVRFQYAAIEALADQMWLQLLLISPLLLLVSPVIVSYALRWRRKRMEQRVAQALKQLLVAEIPLRDDELRPYENQFEGNGESRAWPAGFFVGQGSTSSFTRLVAPRLSGLFFQYADTLRTKGQFAPGGTIAKIAQALAPNHPAPYFVLGKIWYDKANYGRAMVEFSRSKGRNSTAYAAPIDERIAWCLYNLNQYRQAIEVADQALTKMPTLTSARWVRGLARLRNSQEDTGLADCRQAALAQENIPLDVLNAIKAASNAHLPWANEAENLLTIKKPAQKRLSPRKHILRTFAIAGAIVLAIGVLWGIPYLNKLVESDSDFRLGFSNVLLGIFPRAPALLDQRCYANTDLQRYDQAIADCNEAIRLDPSSAAAYSNRGAVYIYLREYDKAFADLIEAIRLKPDYARAFNNRGWAYNNSGQYEKALADLNEAIRLKPDFAEAFSNRGDAYYYLGQKDRAIADYEKSVERFEAQGRSEGANWARSMLEVLK